MYVCIYTLWMIAAYVDADWCWVAAVIRDRPCFIHSVWTGTQAAGLYSNHLATSTLQRVCDINEFSTPVILTAVLAFAFVWLAVKVSNYFHYFLPAHCLTLLASVIFFIALWV